MYRIGDFARLSQTPIKTLRYYDEIGLLRPARTVGSTGYRYYAATQLEQLNRILVLKDLGFSLREIRDHDELERTVNRERARLARAAARLELIEKSGHPAAQDVAIRGVGRQLVASLRATLRDHDESERLFEELERETGRGRVRVHDWPAQRVTSLVYRGDDDYLPAYRAVHAWLRVTGTEVVGPKHEIYLAHASGDTESVTEIQFPIAGDPAVVH